MELRVLHLPLVRFFETSFGRVSDRSFVLVTVEEAGAIGVGECVADAHPYYSAETTGTAWHVISTFVAPLVLGRRFDHPGEILAALSRIRGHNMAKAAVEMAAWDLFARQQNASLASVLGGHRTAIEAGVSIGIQDSLDELVERVRHRARRRLPPGQDQDQARMGRRARWRGCGRRAARCR